MSSAYRKCDGMEVGLLEKQGEKEAGICVEIKKRLKYDLCERDR